MNIYKASVWFISECSVILVYECNMISCNQLMNLCHPHPPTTIVWCT